MGTALKNNHGFTFLVWGAPVAIAIAGALPAQSQESTGVQLPTIVVSPTTIETPLSQIGSSVTTITGEELERDQRRTVPDVLATVPGLNIIQNGGPGGATTVFMRGANSDQTKILIDGINVSDPSNSDRVFDLGHLLTADIDRIEILRGPQSGLYGADAIGGVIAIYTKKGSGPAKVTGTVEGGSFGTFNQTAQITGATASTDYAFTAAHFRATSTPVTPEELLPAGRSAIDNSYDNWTFSTKLGHAFSENFSVNLVGRYTDAKLKFTGDEFPPFPALPVPAAQQSTQLNRQFYTRGEAVWSLWDDRFKNYFGLAYTDAWSSNDNPNFPPLLISQGQRVKADWRGYLTIVPGQTLVMGLEDETEQLRIRQFGTLRAENGNKAGYLEWQSAFAERFFLTSNIRHDINDRFGGATTWRIASSFLVPVIDTKLKASYGTGFKAPTLSQLFQDFPPFFFANRNLQPEESTGYDFGFEQPFMNDRFRVGVTWFHNDIKNLINFNSTFSSNKNIGRATTRGEEVFVSANIAPNLKVRADYTHTIAVNAVSGEELLRRPRHKASLNVIWNPAEGLTTSATVLYVGSWKDVDRFGLALASFPSSSYTLVNLAANYAASEHVTLFGRIDNVLDKHYQDPIGFERPGIGIYAGLRLTQ